MTDDLAQLLADISDLQQALDECEDPQKQTRLKLVLVSRRQQLADLRGKAEKAR
jgi:hypothetical protein